jgi:hypothetical protein
MLVLIDESGDCGLKFGRGSSEFFTCIAVLFQGGFAADASDKVTISISEHVFVPHVVGGRVPAVYG